MELIPVLIFPLLLVVAGVYDLTTMTIPNWISGVLIVSFLVLSLFAGLPLIDIGISLAVGFVMLLVGMGLFALRWLGGGDVKLLASAAIWFGFPATFSFLVFTMLAGGAATVILLTFRKVRLPVPVAEVGWLQRLHRADEDLPYGVAIAFAGLVAIGEAPLFKLLAS